MRTLKKIIKAIVATIALLAIAIGIYYFAVIYQPYTLQGIQKNPSAQLIKSLNLTLTTYANSSGVQLPAAIRKTFSAGSIDIQLSDEGGSTLHNKLYLRNNGFALLGSAVAEDKTTAETYGIWLTEDVIIGCAPALLQKDTRYGVNFKTLKEDIKDSDLLEAMGMSYEEFCQMWDSYTGEGSAQGNTPTENEPSKNENPEQVLQQASEILEIIRSCPVSVSEGTTAVSSNETSAVYRIAYTFTPDKICQILELVQKMQPTIPVRDDAVVTPMSLSEEGPQKNELELLQEEIMRTNATAVIEFDLHATSQMIVAAKCRIDWLEDGKAGTVSATILLGKSPNALHQEARLTTIMPGQEKKETIVTLTKSNAHNMPGRKLTLTSNGETVTLLDLQYNTVTHTFEADLMDREISLSGSCITDETGVFTVAIDSNKDISALTLVFDPNDKTPALPAYTNLCDLTYLELEELVDSLSPEDPEWDNGDKYAEIAIYEADGSVGYMAFWHDYETLGELLVAEGCAELDANGRIKKVYLFGERAEGDAWTVVVQNTETDGFVMDIPLGENEQVAIFGQYGKNT